MHRALQRQLKRTLGIDDPAALDDLLRQARETSANADPAVLAMIDGLSDFILRVDATYEQSDRDLELRTRSLELSSAELGEANARLREDIAARNRAMGSLKRVLAELVGDDRSGTDGNERAPESIEFISQLIQEIVGERELQRHKLDNLKFALDEHAIVSITDTQGRITYANDRFCGISGYAREELLGENHRVVKSSIHPKSFYEQLWESISAGRVWHGEICNRSKAGDHYWVSATIVPLLDAHGLPQEYIAIRTDISEQKRTELALADSRDAAEAASRAKSEFLANMSHEIRTPMNGVIGMTDLVLDTDLDDEQREYLSVVKSSAQSLLVIINDILDFSKIEAGHLSIEAIPFDLRRTLAETLKTLAPRAHEKSLEILSEVTEGVPERLIGDPGRVRQIIVNLVGNAIKFTHEGSIFVQVDLLAMQDSHATVNISIKDTGIGIASEKMGLIFDAFTQEDSSTTRRYGGTGLGLTICRRLVELMGGKIGVDSTLGQGSNFHFSVQLRIDDSPAPPSLPLPNLSGMRALIVDDNPINQQILSRMLGRWKMTTSTASCSEAAQEWLGREQTPDLILLDVQMGKIDGFELAAWIRDQTKMMTVPIIVLSSGAMRGDGQRCRELGLNGYFPKPVVEDELRDAVNTLFGQSESSVIQSQPLLTRHELKDRAVCLQVLLVEDHPVNQQLALSLLTRWGHACTLAGNGQIALDLLATGQFDVCLMDMQMPVMGGLECTRRIRAREAELGLPSMHIIAMTANAMKGDREACMAAGMNDYLAKPIKSEELRAKLNGLQNGESLAQLPTMGAGNMIAETVRTGSAYYTTPIFDYGCGLERMDQEILEIIAPVFLEHYMSDMNELRQAVEDQDFPVMQRCAHSLKGTLASFGANPAQRHAATLESAGLAQSTEKTVQTMQELDVEVAGLVAALSTWQTRQT